MTDQALPGPGWYTDPNDPTTNRYWDGRNWTENRAPISQAAQKADFEAADGVGYALAILLPLIGFIVGLVRINKSSHGIWIVVTSTVVFFLWLALVASAGSASAATSGVTLDPGTKLTVVCEKRMPFRGLPFTEAATGEPLPLLVRSKGFRHLALDDPNSPNNLALVQVRKTAPHRFLMIVGGTGATRWRGC
jgi:hypothetical protein